MYTGTTIFSQVMRHLPWHRFHRIVQHYRGDYKVKSFRCADHYRVMAFAQLTFRESLRDIEACLRAMRSKLFHMGIRSTVSRNNLSNANERRDWRIYAEFAQVLIAEARRLYTDEDLGVDLNATVYALDSTTIDLCLSVFPWARRYSHPVDRTTGLICDQTVLLSTFYPAKAYPEPLRRIKFFDVTTDLRLVFLTNDFASPALTIVRLYKLRWQIELFFKWIKQHLRIRAFYGTSPNAVKTQIWIALSTYLLIAIIRKRLYLELPLYTILQVLSVSLFEKTPILRAFQDMDYITQNSDIHKQLMLFD